MMSLPPPPVSESLPAPPVSIRWPSSSAAPFTVKVLPLPRLAPVMASWAPAATLPFTRVRFWLKPAWTAMLSMPVTLVSVMVWAAANKVRLSVPPPPLMPLVLASAVPSVIVSSWLPPVMVSVLLIVIVLAPSEDRVSLSAVPPLRLIEPDAIAVASDNGVVKGAADDGLDVGDRQAVGAVEQGELVRAAAEVDVAAGLAPRQA